MSSPLFAFLLAVLPPHRQAFPQSDVNLFNHVLQLSDSAQHELAGTGFLVNSGGMVRLVTAAHNFDRTGRRIDSPLYIHTSDGWKLIPATIKYSSSYDVAVLDIGAFAGERPGIPLCPSSSFSSDDPVTFWGFPFQRDSYFKSDDLSGYIIPLVKHAWLAGSFTDKEKRGFIVLDAMNDAGFSGGPVLAKRPGNKVCAGGVVLSYATQSDPVYRKDGTKTTMTVHPNAGLMFAAPPYSISELIDDGSPSK